MKLEVGLEGEDTGGKECLSGRRFERRGVADAESILGIIIFVCSFSNLRDQFAGQAAKLSRKPDRGVDLMSSQEAKISSLLWFGRWTGPAPQAGMGTLHSR